MRSVTLLLLTGLAGCAMKPQMVMLNPRTGVQVDCELPDPTTGSGEFLASRACLSACQAHGFRVVPGARSTSAGGGFTPAECTN